MLHHDFPFYVYENELRQLTGRHFFVTQISEDTETGVVTFTVTMDAPYGYPDCKIFSATEESDDEAFKSLKLQISRFIQVETGNF
jgi:hypothetical protein